MGWKPKPCPKDCIYRGQEYTPGQNCCNYLFIEDKLRGCDMWPNCDKYRSKSRPSAADIAAQNSAAARKPKWNTALGYQLWNEGKSLAQIAAIVGATKATVYERSHRCWKNGIV